MARIGWGSAWVVPLLLSCGSNSFRGSTSVPRGDKTEVIPQGEQTPHQPPSQGEQTPHQPLGEAPQDPCVDQNRSYRVLIVDLKSGWFAGDGGDFFNGVVNNVCGGQVVVSYVHLTTEDTVSNMSDSDLRTLLTCNEESQGFFVFKRKVYVCTAFSDLTGFDSLWLLSGDEADEVDVRLNSPVFQSLQMRAAQLRDAKPSAGFFFGAGIGNVQHTNVLAKSLFPQIFGQEASPDRGVFSATGGPRGTLPNSNYPDVFAHQPLLPGDGNGRGTFLQSAMPFRGFASGAHSQARFNLFDYTTGRKVTAEGNLGEGCLSDAVSAVGGITLATDHCGQRTIVQFQSGEHAIVTEGNTARFYGDRDYFYRMVLHLLP